MILMLLRMAASHPSLWAGTFVWLSQSSSKGEHGQDTDLLESSVWQSVFRDWVRL